MILTFAKSMLHGGMKLITEEESNVDVVIKNQAKACL
jgi:hypothetical protein